MLHRHLNHRNLTLAAIDDVIARGRWKEWTDLRHEVIRDQSVLERVRRVCHARLSDPYAQRYHFWMHYTEKHSRAS